MENFTKKYEAASELLVKDCAKLYGVLLGQMSEASQTRVNKMSAGKRAIEECDPLGLLICVVATKGMEKRTTLLQQLETFIITK